jgi:hypothetical protein
MKKGTSLVLIFSILYSLMGFYLVFNIEKDTIKEEIKEKLINSLPENELSLIKISSGEYSQITWTEEGREFRYNGNMFDVVKIKIRTDTTYYYCYIDQKENKLFSNLDELVKDQTDSSKSKTNQKKQEIIYFYCDLFFHQCITETPVLYFNCLSLYQSIDADILFPPPKKLSKV